MQRLAVILSLLIACTVLGAAESRIAVLNTNEVDEIIKTRVLAKPANAELKKQLAELEKKTRLLDQKHDAAEEAQKKAIEIELNEARHEQNEASTQLDRQIKGERTKIVKDFIKGKFTVVLDANYANEAIISKDADVAIVDITVDIRDLLLVF